MEILSNSFNININKQNQPSNVTKEVISNSFNININKQNQPSNEAPIISNVSVEDISSTGTFTLSYIVTDKENDILTHSIKINDNEYVSISPTITQNTYKYKVTGLSEGKSYLYIKVSDGANETISDKIEVNIVDTVVPPESSEITQALKLYSEKLTLLRSAMQAVQNKISQNQSNAVKEYAKSEIKQLADRIELRVEKNGVISSINQTAEEIKIDAGKINLHGAVSITNPTYEDRYIKIENDSYIGINKDTTKMVLGFKSPRTGQSENSPVVALGHGGVNSTSPYLLMQDYPAIYNPIGLSMAFSELAYQFKQNNFSSLRFLGNGSIELNAEDYMSVGTYKSGKREELLHIKKLNGKGCIGTGTVEAETLSAVATHCDTVQSEKPLVLEANKGDAGVVLYGTSVKCFEPMEGFGGQIYCGSSWSPWKGVYSASTYSSRGVVASDEKAKLTKNVEIDNVIDNINFITNARTSSDIQIDVTNIIDTNFVEVDEYQNVNINESELLKLALLEIKKLKQEISTLKSE